jgi:hypothetical protein
VRDPVLLVAAREAHVEAAVRTRPEAALVAVNATTIDEVIADLVHR